MKENTKKRVRVVAALIRDGNKFMICQRPKDKARALKWEFAGGKVEKGESDADALVRECFEELGVTVRVGEKYIEVFHRYDDIAVDLALYEAKIVGGTVERKEHTDVRYITKDEIDGYDFCDADADILDKIRSEPS